MKTQKQFTFSKYRQVFIPLEDFSPVDEYNFKEKLTKSGYLYQPIRKTKMMVMTAYVAKANIPKAERIKLQEGIFDVPPTNYQLVNK